MIVMRYWRRGRGRWQRKVLRILIRDKNNPINNDYYICIYGWVAHNLKGNQSSITYKTVRIMLTFYIWSGLAHWRFVVIVVAVPEWCSSWVNWMGSYRWTAMTTTTTPKCVRYDTSNSKGSRTNCKLYSKVIQRGLLLSAKAERSVL